MTVLTGTHQNGYGTQGRYVFADYLDYRHNGDGQKHSHHTPEPAPDQQADQDKKGAEVEPPPLQARIQNISKGRPG